MQFMYIYFDQCIYHSYNDVDMNDIKKEKGKILISLHLSLHLSNVNWLTIDRNIYLYVLYIRNRKKNNFKLFIH